MSTSGFLATAIAGSCSRTSDKEQHLVMDVWCVECIEQHLVMYVWCVECIEQHLVMYVWCVECNEQHLVMYMWCVECIEQHLVTNVWCVECIEQHLVMDVWCVECFLYIFLVYSTSANFVLTVACMAHSVGSYRVDNSKYTYVSICFAPDFNTNTLKLIL